MNAKLPVFADKPPSEDFEDAFSSRSGGCLRVCACGRTVFDVVNRWDWEDGELEELEKKHAENPEEYIPADYSVSTMTIGGDEWVMGCPCNKGRVYQNFINGHDEQIADYLRRRAKDFRGKAEAIEPPPVLTET